MIEFKNVSKSFDNHEVLKNLNFTIESGKLVALIGASGCGKTTTLKMINRLINPSSGQILVDGNDVMKEDVIHLRRSMGYVIQSTGLFPHMTVRQNIELIERIEHRDETRIAKRTAELMNMVNMPAKYLDRYPNELSGGQVQRIGVARAFATDPGIILMDEPFSALDPLTRSQLQEELVTLQAKLKKTIVFVTHDMGEAIKVADKICVMYQGEILQYDIPEIVLKKPINEYVSNFVGKHRIWEFSEYIKVRDLMFTDSINCDSETTLFHAVERMRSHHVDSLMVIDEEQHLLGILYARDIWKSADWQLPVREMMKPVALTVDPDMNITTILKTVRSTGVSCIPVTDMTGKLCGMITKSSLVSAMSAQFIDENE